MANIVKRIMIGTELVGYVTDSLVKGEKYLTRTRAINAIRSGNIINASVGVVDGNEVVKGTLGTNLNNLERLNLNIDGLNKNILSYAKNQYDILYGLILLSEHINDRSGIGKAYNLMYTFKKENKMDEDGHEEKMYNNIEGIRVRTGNENSLVMDMLWYSYPRAPYSNLTISVNDDTVNIMYDVINKIGKEEKNTFEVSKDKLLVKLNGVLRYIKNSTYMNKQEALEEFKNQHKGKTPQEVDQENTDKAILVVKLINNHFKGIRDLPEVKNFIQEKSANITDIRSYTTSRDRGEKIVTYEFEINWRQRGYKQVFKLKFSYDISYDINIPFSTFININLIKENGLCHNMGFNPNELGRVKLSDIEESKITEIAERIKELTMRAVMEANKTKDKSNSEIVKSWFVKK